MSLLFWHVCILAPIVDKNGLAEAAYCYALSLQGNIAQRLSFHPLTWHFNVACVTTLLAKKLQKSLSLCTYDYTSSLRKEKKSV